MTTGASASQRQHRKRFDKGSLSRRQRRQCRKSTSRYSTERLRSWVVLPYPAAEHLRQVQNVFAEIVFFGNSLPARLGHLAAQLWVPDKAPDRTCQFFAIGRCEQDPVYAIANQLRNSGDTRC